MTDVKREALSAFMDGEAQELEVHRLMRDLHDDEGALKASWARYGQLGFVALQRGGEGRAKMSPAWHQRLHGSISQAIAAEPAHGGGQPAVASRRRRVYGAFALAASLVVAAAALGLALLGGAGGLLGGGQTPAPIPAQAGIQDGQGGLLGGGGDKLPPAASGAEATAAPQLTELDADKQRQLRAYLNQHSRMARLAGRSGRVRQSAQGGLFQFASVTQGAGEPRRAGARRGAPLQEAVTSGQLDWQVRLPEGFKPVRVDGNRLYCSDGVANLSVFVESAGEASRVSLPEAVAAGSTVVVTHSSNLPGHHITVVGDVSVRMAQRVARSVMPIAH